MTRIKAINSGRKSRLILCPRSSYTIYIVSYYYKWVTTSWTHSTTNRRCSAKVIMKDEKITISPPALSEQTPCYGLVDSIAL